MRRQFLTGAATALLLLVLGLQVETRMPDEAGPGEETVAIHGLCVYRRAISREEAGRLSPFRPLGVAVGVIAGGAVLGGVLAVLLRWPRQTTASPPPAPRA